MTRTRRRIALVGGAGAAATAGIVALAAANTHRQSSAIEVVLLLALMWSFLASGMVALSRRPSNRTGLFLIAVGLAWAVNALNAADAPIVFAIGLLADALPLVLFVHLLLAYPEGVITARAERLLIAVAYPVALLANLTPLLVDRTPLDGCAECPRNVLLIAPSARAAELLGEFWNAVGVVLLSAAAALLIRRFRRASAPARRVLVPVYAGGLTSLALLVAGFAIEPVAAVAGRAVIVGGVVAFLLVPFLFVTGLLRTRLARTGIVRLVAGTGTQPAEMERALREALGDRTLRLYLWRNDPARYVDSSGNPAALPDDDERALVTLTHEGRPVAAVAHDPALRDEPDLRDDALAALHAALVADRSVEALEVSERRNCALLSAIPDDMLRIGADGEIRDLHVDDATRRAAVAGLAPGALAVVRRVIATGEPETVESREVRAGEPVDLEARFVRSGPDEVLAIIRDVTERRRAEDEIARQAAFLSTVINAAASLLVVVDPDGAVERCNAACVRIMQRSDDETRGRPLWDAFGAPVDRAAIEAAFRDGAADVVHQHRWQRQDGQVVLVEWSATALVDESGRPRRLVHGVEVTERERQKAELRESRARLVEAQATERRRLERNLHDGAQQRIVSLALLVRVAERSLPDDAVLARDTLAQVGGEITLALAELRELARGIHPAVLTDRGLAAAIEGLAARSAVPVVLDELPTTRLEPAVEEAAFYVVAEALTNVAKYAGAGEARVAIAVADGRLRLSVRDEGVGGADAARGTGLRGLVDRVEALDGELAVSSPPGGGTVVHATIPLGD